MTGRKKTGILISGRGSNMQALIRAAQDPHYPAEIAVVISNRPNAQGLDFAKAQGIRTEVIDHKAYGSREDFDRALDSALRRHHVEIIACAGFMRVMTKTLVEAWRDRMINIHPSLLPAYKGLHSHERALADGATRHGATVHFVRHDVDSGPIIAQARVPVLKSDTPETLAQRVLDAEHKIYPKALALVASGALRVEGEEVVATAPGVTLPVVIPVLP
ncbi:phosphoribosylglycinamide formyltransferase [Taklimakanibacter deserti]|uniref:phosphoribosylglycinamide formyltransferase n=1 Tax=Taklimakanibacter deserti TaxID=2267839 RepID=UPI000E65D08E